ncbi:MAG: CoA transferase [Polyangiales bacterium]
MSGVQMADIAGGAMWAVIGVLGALRQQDQRGHGGVVDIAMSRRAAPRGLRVGRGDRGEPAPPRGAFVLDGGIAPYNTYRTADGAAVSLGALGRVPVRLRGRRGVELDGDALRPGPHQAALRAPSPRSSRRRRETPWAAFGAAHDCCLEPVLRPEELPTDPQHAARGVFFAVTGDDGGARTVFRTPVGAGSAVAHHGPRRAGEDTDAVLRDAGFSDDERRALRGAGALG